MNLRHGVLLLGLGLSALQGSVLYQLGVPWWVGMINGGLIGWWIGPVARWVEERWG